VDAEASKARIAQIRGGVRRLSAILERFLRQDRFISVEQIECRALLSRGRCRRAQSVR
jgi:hypothetical protein